MSPHSATSRCLILLQKCKNMDQLKQAHSLIFTTGLGPNSYALSRVLAFCSDPQRGNTPYAWRLFQRIQNPTVCIWNTMVKAFLVNDEPVQTVHLYREMLRSSTVVPDNYTLPCVLKACAKLQSPLHGELVHGQSLKSGLSFDIFVGNSLISMYSEVRDMEVARQVFDEMTELCTVSWMVMISSYAKMGEVEKARLFFDLAPVKDRGIWGAMVSGYFQNGHFKEGLCLFRKIQSSDVGPDEAMYASALSACAHSGALDIGIWIHKLLVGRIGTSSMSVRLGTSLIDMYGKCGNFESAKDVFTKMPYKDTICWNAMISAMAMHGRGDSALELFEEMEKNSISPDDITFLNVLAACSHSGMVLEGLRMFGRMSGFYQIEPKSEHFGCMVDLLSRGGLFKEAKEVIRSAINNESQEEIAWRAVMSACYEHGAAPSDRIGLEKLFGLKCGSGTYILLSNMYAASGRSSSVGRVRNLMKSRGIEKVPGCSSIEINGIVNEFIAGETMHPHMTEIRFVLENLSSHF